MSFFGVTSGARTHDTRNHNPMLCQLSYSHRVRSLSKAGAKVLLFFDMTKYFAKKMSRMLFLLIFFRFFLRLFRWFVPPLRLFYLLPQPKLFLKVEWYRYR